MINSIARPPRTPPRTGARYLDDDDEEEEDSASADGVGVEKRLRDEVGDVEADGTAAVEL